MSLKDRHPCFQSGDPVDELLVLLVCQTHSYHGCNHNNSSRKLQEPECHVQVAGSGQGPVDNERT